MVLMKELQLQGWLKCGDVGASWPVFPSHKSAWTAMLQAPRHTPMLNDIQEGQKNYRLIAWSSKGK